MNDSTRQETPSLASARSLQRTSESPLPSIAAQTDPSVYREMGLNDYEYQLICEILGREPTRTELGMYAVMWSEHCGYKYSRPVLRLFKNYREAVEAGSMENAGVIPIGDGLGVVFKMESHNHPSAVEPFQGAATGVGGILRDIFTMGARPIASMDSIRFGPLTDRRSRFLLNGVVGGIAFYGNCVGVPTVGGEAIFHPCYSGNPLVNAMAVGLVRLDKIATAAAKGIGNPVLLVGSNTGRDGIHACSVLASAEISEESLANRPAVQAGDPFTEKLLIEATLEALATGHILGIQDMGAAGITCATCETAAKGDVGMQIDVLKVPRREVGMTPYEVMLSESQERMLAIVEAGREDEVAAIFHKWDLNAVRVGTVTDDGFVTVTEGEEIVARVPAKSLADECPTYTLEIQEPEYIRRVQNYDFSGLPETTDFNATLRALLSSPNIAHKGWIFQQYDHMVQDNSVVLPGSDAAVIRIKPLDAGAITEQDSDIVPGASPFGTKGLGITVDCNSRYCYLNPYEGSVLAVAEAARNLSCSGALPKGVTDCLNFANPEKPEVFWQFRRSVEGLAAACEAFETPVVSGNVSFYNETPDTAIYPTPAIGMVGVFHDISKRCVSAFQGEGDRVYLMGPTRPSPDRPHDGIGGSEYLSLIHGMEVGDPPSLDLEFELRLQRLLRDLISDGLLRSAHDCSDGGLAVTLSECALLSDIGADLRLPESSASPTWQLFSEAQSRVAVTVSPESEPIFLKAVQKAEIPLALLGVTGGDSMILRDPDAEIVRLGLEEGRSLWKNAIVNRMEEGNEESR